MREICDISSDDIDDPTMESIIQSATTQLNSDVNVEVVEEEAAYIDQYRKNKKDGSNTTYYVQDSWKAYIGDRDCDGDVDTSDVKVYVYDSAAETKTEATVSSIDAVNGSVVLSSAPASGTKVKITYSKAPLDEDEPHQAIKEACMLCAASLAYLKLRGGDYGKLRLGDLTLDSYSGALSANRPFTVYKDAYYDLVQKIVSGDLVKIGYTSGLPFLKHYAEE